MLRRTRLCARAESGARKRLPFLERLATHASILITGMAPSGEADWPPNMPLRAYWMTVPFNWRKGYRESISWYNGCLAQLAESGVVAIESDKEFESKAKGVVLRYMQRHIRAKWLPHFTNALEKLHMD